jgi:outer membrane protein assembly factor BamD
MKQFLILCLVLISLGACSSTPEETESTLENRPVEELYNQGVTDLDAGQYKKSVEYFDTVEREYPYSEWATRAKLMAAYALYKDRDYDRAIYALDRFIELHPGNERVDYAFYLKALCYYDQISDIRRDQKMTERATESLQDVISRFPNSSYARDAKFKLDLTFDHLAGREMDIGRFYQREGQFQSAINRFLVVVKRYETTTHAPEALFRLVEAYTALGLTEEAKRNAAVLGHNYPNSLWYKNAYALSTGDESYSTEEGFLTRAWRSVTN